MTRQIRDKLIYEGKVYSLNQEILEPFFQEFPDKKPKSEVRCTALWRGYLATFEVRDRQLFLKELDVFEDTRLNLRLIGQLFPNQNKFEWFSGLIRIDEFRGRFDDECEGHIFEYLEFYQGDFVRLRKMAFAELQEFKGYQFEYFKESPAYQTAFMKWRKNNPEMPKEEIDAYLMEGLLHWYTSEVFDNPLIP